MKRNRSPTNKPVMKRYATLDSSFGSRSFSVRAPIVLLSFSYRSPIVLLLFSYHPPIVLLLGNGKQYGNDTGLIRKQYGIERRMSEGRAKDERKTNE